jgi:hypothetical protein
MTLACGPSTKERRHVEGPPAYLTENVPIEEELRALLERKDPAAKKPLRIAVMPFKVSGPNAKELHWIGDAAAIATTSKLTQLETVSVLERNELTALLDLKRAADTDADGKRVATAGKLVGAERVVLGEIVQQSGDTLRVFFRPVRVEDGRVLAVHEATLSASNWSEELDEHLTAHAAEVFGGGVDGPAAAGTPLSPSALQLVTKARELQAKGDLLGAQPLYEQALAKPSTSWDVEADYVRVLNDLGMREAGRSRADEVLGRMPEGAATACPRAKLAVELARAISPTKLSEARESLRFAVQCADPTVEAAALRMYSHAARYIDFPLALAALEQAERRLGKEGNDWERCWLRWTLHGGLMDFGLDAGSSRNETFSAIGKACEAAGNTLAASYAYQVASEGAFTAREETSLLEASERVALKNGGSALVANQIARANNLRRLGKPSEADAKLLEAIGDRLRAIDKRLGGLPPLERQLDRDLRELVGAATLGATMTEPSPKNLIVAAERAALARLLRAWAERTAKDSQAQAKTYRGIADRLDPPDEVIPDEETEDARLERRLRAAGTSLAALESASEAPLRGTVNLRQVEGALNDWVFAAIQADAPPPELNTKQALLAKVAGWWNAPRGHAEVARNHAVRALKEKRWEEAQAAVTSMRSHIVSHAWWSDDAAQLEVRATQDAAKATELRAARLALAKRRDATSWLDAIRLHARDDARTNNQACRAGVDRLLEAERELEGQGAIEEAALAYERAASLTNDCLSVIGSREAVELMVKRSKLLDSLGDPLRSLEGLIGLVHHRKLWVSHGSADWIRAVKADATAKTLVFRVAEGARKLASAGRYRDAARVAAEVEAHPFGELWLEALGWSLKFEDSSEYPNTAAMLHDGLAEWREGGPLRIKHLTKARDLYKAAKRLGSAQEMERGIIKAAGATKAAFDRCVALSPDLSSFCMESYTLGTWKATTVDLDLARHILAKAKLDLPRWEKRLNPMNLNVVRGELAQVALHAGDQDTYASMRREVEHYFKKVAPDKYQWAQFLSKALAGASPSDADLYFQLLEEFRTAGGAGDYWLSDVLKRGMDRADSLGRTEDADRLQRLGSSVAARGYPDRGFAFAVRGARVAVASGRYRDAVKVYDDAVAAAERAALARKARGFDREVPVAVALRASAAQSLALAGDLAGAETRLQEALGLLEALPEAMLVVSAMGADALGLDRGQPVCLEAALQRAHGSLLSASKKCSEADAAFAKAERAATSCRAASGRLVHGSLFEDSKTYLSYRPPTQCGAPFAPYTGLFWGSGTNESQEAALLKLACDRGDPGACGGTVSKASSTADLDRVCQAGSGHACALRAEQLVPRDGAKALRLARDACRNESPLGCAVEARGLFEGWGGSLQQPETALKRLDQACQLGHWESCSLYIEKGGAFVGDR